MAEQPVEPPQDSRSSLPPLIPAPSVPYTGPAGRAEPAARTALALLQRVFADYGPRDFAVRLWDGTLWPADAGRVARFTLALNHPGALRRMFLPPSELNMGEAFVRGDFDVEGDLVACISLADTIRPVLANPLRWPGILRLLLALPRTAIEAGAWRGAARLSGKEHSEGRDRQAITYHYDLPGEFYALFLDRQMQYSCAYFRDAGDDLDTAQENKLAHICRKLRLQPGERLLDIGCGWGGLVAYAAKNYDVQAVGITLSPSQAALARQRIAAAGLSGRCRIDIRDYRKMDEWGSFDKIVSIGMFEHVGRAMLPVYFAQAFRLLKPGGIFLNHGIAGMHLPGQGPIAGLAQRVFDTGAFVRAYVFPDGELEPVSEPLNVAERAGFEVRDVESLREHYALTLRHWVRGLEERREEALRLVDEPTYRVWRLFTAGCAYFFDTARLNVYQAQLIKPDRHGRSNLPLTREYLYTN